MGGLRGAGAGGQSAGQGQPGSSSGAAGFQYPYYIFSQDETFSGFKVFDFPISEAKCTDVVVGSVTEVHKEPPNCPFLGAATITIHNVAPQEGQVSVAVTADWQSDILIRIMLIGVHTEQK